MDNSFNTRVTLRYACATDLYRPHWRTVNSEIKYPKWFWSRIWEYPLVRLYIPKTARSILDIGGTYPDFLFKLFPYAKSVDGRDLGRDGVHPLHAGLWPDGGLSIGDFYSLPFADNSYDYTTSISAFEETPDPLRCIQEALRITSKRCVITLDVSDEYGCSTANFEEIRNFLKPVNVINAIRPLSSDLSLLREFGVSPINSDAHKSIRVVSFIIDKVPKAPNISILIPHWNSAELLKTCIKSIDRLNTTQNLEILVGDDNSEEDQIEELKSIVCKNPRISSFRIVPVHRNNRLWDADVGHILDILIDQVSSTSNYTMMLDADMVALSEDLFNIPVMILSRSKASITGFDSLLSESYRGEYSDLLVGLGLNAQESHDFSIINNLYRVMFTADAKVLREEIGFSRGFSKCHSRYALERIMSRLYWKLAYVLKHLRLPLHLHKGSDNGVRAMAFMHINQRNSAFSIPLIGYRGIGSQEGGTVGQLIGGFLYHLALSTRALSTARREINNAQDIFYQLHSEFTQTDINELVSALNTENLYSSTGSEIYTKKYMSAMRKEFESKIGDLI